MKYNNILFTIMGIIAFISSIFSCQAQNPKAQSLSAEEFEKYIADTSVVRLDVRTLEEYTEGHIAKTLNIDVLKSDFESKAKNLLPKEKTIAIYCRSGKRSKKAVDILTKNDYTVVELSTGYNGWIAAGKEVIK